MCLCTERIENECAELDTDAGGREREAVGRGLDILRTHRYFSAVMASFLFVSLPSQTTVILADAVKVSIRHPT